MIQNLPCLVKRGNAVVNNLNKRVFCLDFIRVVSFIWIVMIWHLGNYVTLFDAGLVSTVITEIVLASFYFIFGILVTSKYKFFSISDALDFWKKRF